MSFEQQSMMTEALMDKCLQQKGMIADLEVQLSELQIKTQESVQGAKVSRRKPGADDLTFLTNQRNRFRMKYQKLVELTKKAVRQRDGNSGPWVLIPASEVVTRKQKRTTNGTKKRRFSPAGRAAVTKNLEKARKARAKKKRTRK
jgi:hypothetical protein